MAGPSARPGRATPSTWRPPPPRAPTSRHSSSRPGPTSSTPVRSDGRRPTVDPTDPQETKKKVLAVCGPTAAGKSDLADGLADGLSEAWGRRVPVVVVDSMQVYSGLGEISNQARRRPAELVSVVPVTQVWTVARHAEETRRIVSGGVPSGGVLDAGTGMYLNAALLDVPLAPRVAGAVRERARLAAAGRENPRRASRALELEMSGAPRRGSIWDGDPVYDTTLLYLRPDRAALDSSIARRSRKIVARGLDEAGAIRGLQERGLTVNPSVLGAVGVKELLRVVDGEMDPTRAEEEVAVRTRRLARRQIRWFDKLAKTLKGRARVAVVESPEDPRALHTMHDIMHGIVG